LNCTDRITGKEFAVKIMQKKMNDPNSMQITITELKIFQRLGNYKHVVTMKDIFENDVRSCDVVFSISVLPLLFMCSTLVIRVVPLRWTVCLCESVSVRTSVLTGVFPSVSVYSPLSTRRPIGF
jgi:serine/threonine protein kinase